jgi:hypothetical protein
VRRFKQERGADSSATGGVEEARQLVARVAAARRRQAALAAACDRETARAATAEKNRLRAHELQEESAALEEQAVMAKAEDVWRKRTAVERTHTEWVAGGARWRFMHRLFTPNARSNRQMHVIDDGDNGTPACAESLSLLASVAHEGRLDGAIAFMSGLLTPSGDAQRSAVAHREQQYTSRTGPPVVPPSSAPTGIQPAASPARRTVVTRALTHERDLIRSLVENPTDRTVEALKTCTSASPAIVDGAARLVQLLRESEELERASNRRRGDILAIRRDEARLQQSSEAMGAPSERLLQRTLAQEAARSNILATIAAERAARGTKSGETMAARHAQHAKVEGCSRRLYEPKALEEAKISKAAEGMMKQHQEDVRRAALKEPLSRSEQAAVKRLYETPVKRREMIENKLEADENARFEKAILASSRKKLSDEDAIAASTRLAHRSLSRGSTRKGPSRASPVPKLSKDDLAAASARVFNAGLAKQKAENDRLDSLYLRPLAAPSVKLAPIQLKASADRLFNGERADVSSPASK